MTIANTNVIAKVAAVVAGLGLVAMSFAVAPAKAATVAEIEAQIAALQAQLGSSTTSNTCVFTRDLTIGSQGADVTCLQTTLAAKGYFNVAPTGYFGPVTQGSVAKWQIAAGITPPAGYFGPISRSAFTAMGGSTGGSTGGNTGGSTGGSSLSGGEATLSDFDLRREETSGYEGEEEVEVATAEFDVEDGDVRVERLEIMASSTSTSLDMKPWNYFDRVIVWADGKEIGDMDVDNRNDWDEQGNDVYRLVVTGLDYVVDEGDKAEITFGFDINSNIDTADLQNSFDFYIEDDGIRAVDSEGIQQYIGDTADTVNFGFDAEENGDLKIKSSSNDPESSILIADENNESEEYTVFVFDLDNQDQADSLVTDITVGITSSTDGDDFIRRATLVVDGDEYDGDINADTIEFTDLDTEIAGDDRVEVELMITLVSDAPSATATFTIAGADIDAEGVDSGDDANVTGSQSSETHTVALTGVAVEAGSTSISSNDTETVGTFRIEFEITALEDDQYIFKGADNASSSTSGVIYTIYAGNTATTSFYGTASDLLQSTADDSDNGDYYVIQSGDTETFTLTVTLDPTATGLYFVELNAVRYDPDNAEDTSAIDDDTYTVPNDADFQTSAQSLQAGS